MIFKHLFFRNLRIKSLLNFNLRFFYSLFISLLFIHFNLYNALIYSYFRKYFTCIFRQFPAHLNFRAYSEFIELRLPITVNVHLIHCLFEKRPFRLTLGLKLFWCYTLHRLSIHCLCYGCGCVREWIVYCVWVAKQ